MLCAAELNFEPQYTVCHPVLQQPRAGSPGQLQCFCTSHQPMHCLLQSVASPVGAVMLNKRTPFTHCLIISSFEALKASSRSGLQTKGTWGLRSWRKGSKTSDRANVYAICCTQPNQLRMSVKFLGGGKLRMLLTNSVLGLMPVLVMLKPKYCTSSQAN